MNVKKRNSAPGSFTGSDQSWNTAIPLLYQWLMSRRGKKLLLGLPAIVVTAMLIYCLTHGRTTKSRAALLKPYETAAHRAQSSGEFEKSELFFRRAVSLSNGTDICRYNHALSLQKLGQQKRSLGIIQSLAPVDRTGYLPAHQFLAQHLQSAPQPDATALTHHLRQILIADPNSSATTVALARTLARQQNFQEARQLLNGALSKHPEAHILMAQLLVKTGQHKQAHQEFDRAEEFYKRQLHEDPNDTQSLILLAQAMVFRGRFKDAEEILAAGLSHQDSQPIRDALVIVYISWFDLTDNSDVATKVRCLDAALKLKNDHPAVIQRCARFQFTSSDTEKSDVVTEQLNAALANGTAPTVVHVLLGTDAARKSDFRKALVHLEQAQLQSPDQPIVNNNLAWVLHQQSKSNRMSKPADRGTRVPHALVSIAMHPGAGSVISAGTLARQTQPTVNDSNRDRNASPPTNNPANNNPAQRGRLLDRALVHATKALEQAPRVPEFLETRGQILTDMKQWNQSIRDLEAALQQGYTSDDVHHTLAIAYEAVGLNEQAEQHRRIVAERTH